MAAAGAYRRWRLFDPKRQEPMLLRSGDTVRFAAERGYVEHDPRRNVHLGTGWRT
jgi:allophanate hydrolase subunit 1